MSTDAIIGFRNSFISTPENVSSPLSIIIELMVGELGRSVAVRVFTTNGSAQGIKLILSQLH